jgi:hypothetical protein
MEESQPVNLHAGMVVPHRAWQTLSPAQQQMVLRRVVQVCQRLSASAEEKTDEPANDTLSR